MQHDGRTEPTVGEAISPGWRDRDARSLLLVARPRVGVPPFELSEGRVQAHALAESPIRLDRSLNSTGVRSLAPADG